MRSWLSLLATVSLFRLGIAVFVDDAGVIDWHHVLLGQPRRDTTFFHQPSPESKASLIYTLSERNVIGAVNPKTGDVVWRQQLTENANLTTSFRAGHSSDTVVSGVGSEVTAWGAPDGRQIWTVDLRSERVKDVEILELETTTTQTNKDSIVLVEGKPSKVLRLNGETGNTVWQFSDDSSDIPHQVSASATQVYYVSLHAAVLGGYKIKVTVLDPTNGKKIEQHTLSSDSEITDPAHVLSVGANSASPIIVWTDKSYSTLKVNVIGTKNVATFAIGSGVEEIVVLAPSNTNSRPHFLVQYNAESMSWAQVFHVDRKKGSVAKAYDLPKLDGRSAFSVTSDGSNVYFTRVTGYEVSVVSSVSHGALAKWRPMGFRTHVYNDDPYAVHAATELSVKGDTVSAARTVVYLSSGDWVLLREDQIAWQRQEQLAHTIKAVWAYPPKPQMLNVKKQKKQSPPANAFEAYIRRCTRHVQDLRKLPAYLPTIPQRILVSLGLAEHKDEDMFETLNSFGFHKMIICATSTGRFLGLDAGAQGKVIWNFAAQEGWEPIPGVDPVLNSFPDAILEWKNRPDSDTSYLFDGSTGTYVDLQHYVGGATWSDNFEKSLAGITGLGEKKDVKTWEFKPSANELIISKVSRPAIDPIASIGRVLGDRKVLYKYINPNLQLIATTSLSKDAITIYLVDSMTGETLHSGYHGSVVSSLPFSSAVSENWFSYSFTSLESSGARATQLVIAELYESSIPDDRGPTNTSERYPLNKPYIALQTYIIPEPISHMTVTQTSQGITSKELLCLLPNSNSLIGIPRAILDPRRPVGRDPSKTEQFEGLMKYTPTLEFDPKWYLNHQRELFGITHVNSSPAVLESTSLVVAWGLDIFGTRVTPSFSFDVLGKDFNKLQMLATVLALGVGTVLVAPLVARKQVNTRWTFVSYNTKALPLTLTIATMSDSTKYTSKLKDKNVLIVGGSAGIGYAVAEASLEHGAHVTISSSQPSRVDKAISSLLSSYPSAKSRLEGQAANMADASALEANIVSLLDFATSNGSKKLDHIVWTAGDALAVMPLSELSVEKVTQAGMVRFFGPVMMGKHAANYLNPGPGSSITLTTGSVSERPIPGWAAPAGFATALHGLNRGLALDLKPIRVNLISPGAVDTELWAGMSEEERQRRFKYFSEKSTTGVVGKKEDVAEAYLYVMRDKNVTGSMISTNAGALLV
ncbi:ER membrane protein complex subunit 1-like protein [Elsinoe fawcettii]|nr:ER membrane protein complex subunit 1-like protein [Elsinoe fawcettii]